MLTFQATCRLLEMAAHEYEGIACASMPFERDSARQLVASQVQNDW